MFVLVPVPTGTRVKENNSSIFCVALIIALPVLLCVAVLVAYRYTSSLYSCTVCTDVRYEIISLPNYVPIAYSVVS